MPETEREYAPAAFIRCTYDHRTAKWPELQTAERGPQSATLPKKAKHDDSSRIGSTEHPGFDATFGAIFFTRSDSLYVRTAPGTAHEANADETKSNTWARDWLLARDTPPPGKFNKRCGSTTPVTSKSSSAVNSSSPTGTLVQIRQHGRSATTWNTGCRRCRSRPQHTGPRNNRRTLRMPYPTHGRCGCVT